MPGSGQKNLAAAGDLLPDRGEIDLAAWWLFAVFLLEILAFGRALAVLGGAVVPTDNLETAADIFWVAGGTRRLAVVLARFADVFNFGTPHFAILAVPRRVILIAVSRRVILVGLSDPGDAKQGQAES